MVSINYFTVVLLFLASGAIAQPQEQRKMVDIESLQIQIPSKDAIVDSRVSKNPRETLISLLVRDVDDVIKCYKVRYRGINDQDQGKVTFLGYAVEVCDPVLRQLLPSDQIPIKIIRSSCIS
jgi:hypothetical protein